MSPRGFWSALGIVVLSVPILLLHVVAIAIAGAVVCVWVIVFFVVVFTGLFKVPCSCTVASWGRVAVRI